MVTVVKSTTIFRAIIQRDGWWRWALVSPAGVTPSRMVGVSAPVNLPLHHKVQNFSSGTSSPRWSRKTVLVLYHSGQPVSASNRS